MHPLASDQRQPESVAVRIFAPAKLNLFLHVLGRRPEDGLHALQSLFVFLSLGDEVTFSPAEQNDLRMTPDMDVAREQNLAWRALSLVQGFAPELPSVQVSVDKVIPTEAGLGGGTADAAAVVHWAEQYGYQRTGQTADIRSSLAGLGADMPPAMDQKARLWTGSGDQPGPRVLGLSGVPVLLLKPPTGVSTRACFTGLKGQFSPPVDWQPDASARDQIIAARNDLEAPAQTLNPEIATALASLGALPGVWLVRMTGSGSACFALFDEKGPRDAALIQLRQALPTWWSAAADIL